MRKWDFEHKEYLKEYRKNHNTGIYGSWYAMKQRCGNPNNKQYKDYGGRGITFIKDWETFAGFKKDMGDSYQKELTIDRIDTNGNYTKENCKWSTRKEQNSNKRCNILIENKTLLQWAKEMNISYGTLRSRYYRGMTINGILQPNLYRPAKL